MTHAAYIFDLDGTLADTSAIWYAAETKLYEALKEPWREDIFRHYLGMNADDVAATIHSFLKPSLDVRTCQRILRQALVDEYEHGPIRDIPGACDLVRRVYGVAPLVVASGSPARGIRVAVERLGIGHCFELLISSEDVARGKPSPDVFLRAAKHLGVAPETCLVFEDSQAGAEAATAAGMHVIVRPVHADRAQMPPQARIVQHWDEVEPPQESRS